ncbi:MULTISPECIES: ATP-binding protein [Hydrocarboniphaga]|uniref:histidine kinase n=1 Tax=Hydrocarboniphaga effusa AP103 TaxID=1172194 RepID=I8HYX7_9GAMM|nr:MULTISPECIES: ATP-binding protein [Hydrocarboniphaga]EIT68721.1 phytochrome family protein, putative [Hydrocarboniphaga effusa AP103]MDZ4076935.1 ATP-binding protein [Hydrocarboniphaga sp.]
MSVRPQTAVDALPQDLLDACDREPIHVPGAIQPHGYWFCLNEFALTIAQLSENVRELAGKAADELLGRPIADLLSQSSLERLHRAVTAGGLLDRPLYLGHMSVREQLMDAIVHRHDGLLILEIEPAASDDESSFGTMYPLVRSFVASLQQTESVIELCELAARETRRITGFGRVLVYRFNDEGHGHVLGESLEPGYESYLDLYFPASDIPKQARELYRSNHIRLIADAHYVPSPLVPALNPITKKPTDLRYSGLRSVSPVHVQYLKNMRTLASMSISIIVRGELWGLISCHHESARKPPFDIRTACEHLGQILSLQIEAKEERSEATHSLELRRKMVSLLSSMTDSDNFVSGLAANAEAFLGFAEASGAAIISGGRCLRLGDAPNEPAIFALVDWIGDRALEGIFSTHQLASEYDGAAALGHHIAGVLAISISQLHQHFLIWFRPEVVQTVRWAGNPAKAVDPESSSETVQRLRPRSSFESWVETVRGRSLPWRRSELEGALEFRGAILAVVLRRAEELASLAEELSRSNRELEAFSYSVSHDLRAPLRHIVGYADLLREFEGNVLSERGTRFLHNIEESAHFAGTLVDNLLSFSQMGRSALRRSDFPLRSLIDRTIADLDDETAGRDIQWHIGELPSVNADPTFLQLALRNLLSNAVKYTRKRPAAEIRIEAEDQPDYHVIHVRDNGVGFNMNYANKLFGVFQRLHRMEDFEGTGIGLANVRRIIERHDGHVWAAGEPDRGATFSFSLPKTNKNTVAGPNPPATRTVSGN